MLSCATRFGEQLTGLFYNQRLCIFGLYGAIQMLLSLFIIVIKKVINMQKASLSVSYNNGRHSDFPPVGMHPLTPLPSGSATG